MKSVRSKLVAIVAGCLVPAIGSAIVRSRDAENDLLKQIENRVQHSAAAFELELGEDEANAELGARMAAADVRFAHALESGDPAFARRILGLIGDLYTDSLVVLADRDGKVLAATDPHRKPASIASPALAGLSQGEPAKGFLALTMGTSQAYALAAGAPIWANGELAGSVVILTPVDGDYLQHIESKIGTNLAIDVDGKAVAFCPDHPDPQLQAFGTAIMKPARGRVFALSTFEVGPLSLPDHRVAVTASEDVSDEVHEAHVDLFKSLVLLGGVKVALLVLAILTAQRMAKAVSKLRKGADDVLAGRYAPVEGVKTGDEIEMLAADFNRMIAGLEERDRLKSTFGRYVTRQVMERLGPKPAITPGTEIVVTVLVADIRGFSKLAATLKAAELFDVLSTWVDGMVEDVLAHAGVVDKVQGDSLVAVFGAPVPHADDPKNAVRAAIAMRVRLATMNEAFRAKGLPEVRVGVGIHTGRVVAGSLRHGEAREWAVVGDTVAIAEELEALTRETGAELLVSEDTARAIGGLAATTPLRTVSIRGRAIAAHRLADAA